MVVGYVNINFITWLILRSLYSMFMILFNVISIFSSANWQKQSKICYRTFSLGKTDNARCHRAADILPPSLSGAELVSRYCSHRHYQTYPVDSRRSGGTKMSQKVNYLIKLKWINLSCTVRFYVHAVSTQATMAQFCHCPAESKLKDF